MRMMKWGALVLSCVWAMAAQAGDTNPVSWKLSSLDVQSHKPMNFKQVFNGFGCEGQNLSPQLTWSPAPSDTKSFAVTMYDPDAPTGSGWWHWVAFNIPADTKKLEQGASKTAMPEGTTESMTDFGSTGYGGPCPPVGHGTHRYIITLWALDVEKLDLDALASGAKVGYFLNQHKIAATTLTGTFKREK